MSKSNKNRRVRPFRYLLSGLMAVGAAGTALATDYIWNGTSGGYWSSADWNSGEAFVVGGDAIFNNASDILVDTDVTANKIAANADTVLRPGTLDPNAWQSAYRYFRFYVDTPKSDSNSMQLSDIMLLDTSGNEISSNQFTIAWDTDAHGANDGTAYPSGEAPGNAVDGNHATKWLDFRAGASRTAAQRAAVYIEFQFPAAINISGYRWYTANDYAGRDPVAWRLLGSSDGVTWTTIDKVQGYNPPTTRQTLAFQRSFAGFSHYRFKVDAIRGNNSQTYMQISDVGLFDENGARLISGTDFTLTCGDGDTSGNEGEANAVDTNADGTGNTGTKWGFQSKNTNFNNTWIQLNLTSPKNISKYNWYTANDTEKTSGGRQPKSWRLLASNDGATWAFVDFQENNTSIPTTNYALAYEKSFALDGSMSLKVGEFAVADGNALAVKSGLDVSWQGSHVTKTGAGTLLLGDDDGNLVVNPDYGFAVAGGTLETTNVTFRLGGTATANRDAPFTVANGADATAVLNGGSLYSVSKQSNPYIALQVGAGAGDSGVLYATNVTVTTRGNIRLAVGEGSSALVEKVGGDWKVQEDTSYGRFYMGLGLNSSSEFYHRGGTLETWSYICIGNNASSTSGSNYFELDGGTVTQGHYDRFIIGDHGGTGVRNELRVKSGRLAAREDIRVANNAPGILTVDGGEVDASSGSIGISYSSESDRTGTLTLNGGVVKTRSVVHGGGAGNGTVVFNGGTLQAVQDGDILPASEKFVVTVAAGGAKIDTAGHTVFVTAAFAAGAESTGGLLAKGGGKITLASGNTYAGATTVELGTTVIIPAPSAILGGIAVTVPETIPADGVYSLLSISGEGTFPASVLTGVVTPTGSRLILSGDGKSILCVHGNPDPTWIGGASGSLSVGANWSTGVVPTSGNCIIGNATAASLVKGDTFAASTITFPSGSAAVVITGEFNTLTAIVNNSTANMTFSGFVDFGAGNVNVTQTATLNSQTVSGGVVNFAGGVRGNDIQNHTIMTGHYTLTKTDNFYFTATDSGRYTVNTNSSLSVQQTDRTEELLILNGGIFSTRTGWNGWSNSAKTHRLWWKSAGEYVAEAYSFNGAGQMWLGGFEPSAANMVLKIGTINVTNSGQLWLHSYSGNETSRIYIGAGGINLSSTGYVGVENANHTQTLWPWNSDYTIGHGNNANYDLLLRDNAAIKLAIQTKDESGVPRTVTLNGRISTNAHADPTITVNGAGTNVVNSTSPLMVGTYAVADTATVVLNNGAGFANGKVSVGETATLMVGESGTASVSNLTLTEGATLGFNFTDKRTAPQLAATSATFPATVNVKVSSANGLHVKGGRYELTSGGAFTGANVTLAEGYPKWVKGASIVDGEIVLDVKGSGTYIIVK